MDNDELKTRLIRLRVPSADAGASTDSLRLALTAFGNKKLAGADTTPWTWLDWLWPSPLAWGAMAALWLAALAHEAAVRPTATERSVAGTDPAFPATSLVASRDLREMIREFQSGQPLR
ncbi:MAG: hypothetical protein ABIZ56_05245 [Chthoniobacteraceae bacterium]